MRLLKCLSHQMEDEVCGTIQYAKDALEYQYDRPNLSKIYFQLAQTEYTHYQTLHEQAIKIINEIQEQNRTYPQSMKNKWEKKHNQLIELAEEAQMYLAMYK